jgi:AmiR/NasT family two-component response regulator
MDRVMTALIVDDEPIARGVLREELEAIPDVRVFGEATDGKDALQKIQNLKPDLVFLDLTMRYSDFWNLWKTEGPFRAPGRIASGVFFLEVSLALVGVASPA